MTNFFKNISKGIENEYMSVASDGIDAGDVTGYIDTGSYNLNAMLSGSIYDGMPSNKITAIAGEEATGKCARGNQKLVVYLTDEAYEKLKNRL